jgi:hypothetical protein
LEAPSTTRNAFSPLGLKNETTASMSNQTARTRLITVNRLQKKELLVSKKCLEGRGSEILPSAGIFLGFLSFS